MSAYRTSLKACVAVCLTMVAITTVNGCSPDKKTCTSNSQCRTNQRCVKGISSGSYTGGFFQEKTCQKSNPVVENICNLPMKPGLCRNRGWRFYYSTREKSCVSFRYQGFYGNKNNFRTLKECQQTCRVVENICNLPMEPGRCRNSGWRFYYSTREKSCVFFFYQGFYGNKNNFRTRKECQQTCGGTNPPSTIPPRGCKDNNGVHHAVGTSYMTDCNRCSCSMTGKGKVLAACTIMACYSTETTTKKPEITARCPPNASWPKLVGKSFEKAKARILHDCPKLFVQTYWNNGPMTLEYHSHRVGVIVNDADRVVKVPSCCG